MRYRVSWTNLKVVPADADCCASQVAPDGPSHDHQPQRASIFQENRPINPQLNCLTDGEGTISFQQHPTATDVGANGMTTDPANFVYGMSGDPKSLMVPAVNRNGGEIVWSAAHTLPPY